ncbi:MAG: hypothetical protein IPG12_11020 [Saprospiraceae bacterium]|nr:hypothetical protein [Saprospiraceae bacterium]
MNQFQNQYLAKAFVSCSLRKEDNKFVDLVANILHHYQILPFGTVGMYEASAENPTQLMKRNIEQADFFVIAATKRYITRDNHNGQESNQLSEMIHAEAGMAFAFTKPVVVFVEEGTNLGTFLPSITQYITLDGTQANLDSQQSLILCLLNNAYQRSEELKRKKVWQELGRLALGGLALFGGLKLLENSDEECYDSDQ